jgi:5-formyltetrahydrofolate cyclo-ligase
LIWFLFRALFLTAGIPHRLRKGYYDKWLVDTEISKRIGLAYEVQLTDKLPTGQYDLPVGKLLTEKRCIEFTTN